MMPRNEFAPARNNSPVPALRQPVSLEVPVRLQGESAHHATFFEDTNTVLVFNGGAVLRVAGELAPGQSVLLTNRATRRQIPCRVSFVRQHGGVRGYAEVEFAASAPGFWDEAPRAAMSEQSPPSFSAATALLSPGVGTAAAGSVRTFESFAQIDNIADAVRELAPPSNAFPIAVAPPAALPVAPAPSKAHALAPLALSAAAVAPAAPLVDEIEQMLAAKRAETDQQAHELARAASDFASRLLESTAPPAFSSALPARPRTNRWAWALAGAALVLTLGTSLGSWGLQAEEARMSPPAPIAPAPPTWAMAEWYAPAPALGVLPLRTSRSKLALIETVPDSVRRAAESRRLLASSAPAAPKLAHLGAIGETAAPEISATPAVNAFALVPTHAANVPAPAVPVESKLEPLRLLHTVKPVYPILARRAGVQGEVVVHARVDETGKIIATRVISGPTALRQAAIEALQQWKYEPARLNGKPVAVDTAVSVKFAL